MPRVLIPYLIGTDAYLTNYMMAADFMEAEERSWQLRYAYDFVARGIPGLTFSTRYNRGDHANPATYVGEGREWERDTDLGYTIQSGPLKNVSMLWRNASLRSNYQMENCSPGPSRPLLKRTNIISSVQRIIDKLGK